MNPTNKKHKHIVPGFRDIKSEGDTLVSKCVTCGQKVKMISDSRCNRWMTDQEIFEHTDKVAIACKLIDRIWLPPYLINF